MWGSHPDPGLSDLGLSQAETVARRLDALGIDHLISSPLKRCRETARPLEKAVRRESSIHHEIAEIPVPNDIDDHRTWLMTVMNGSWADAQITADLRLWRAAIGHTLTNLGQDTIIFSHFVAINAAVGLATGRTELTVFQPRHASVTVLDANEGILSLIELGDESPISMA